MCQQLLRPISKLFQTSECLYFSSAVGLYRANAHPMAQYRSASTCVCNIVMRFWTLKMVERPGQSQEAVQVEKHFFDLDLQRGQTQLFSCF